jgi:succinate dehydrogenase / fumarate reductase cytochrome b subunit
MKFVMGLTGFLLVGFLIVHLGGNLILLQANPEAFNKYAQFLASFGALIKIASAVLLILFLGHAAYGIRVWLQNKSARPERYALSRTKGGPSHSSPASRGMIVAGTLMLVFLIIHLWQVKWGPGMEKGYTAQVAGQQVRDLYRLVEEIFSQPGWVAFYILSMIAVGFHVRHGAWSMFQSLGLMRKDVSPGLRKLALLLALVIAGGFILIPVYMYFDLHTFFQVVPGGAR